MGLYEFQAKTSDGKTVRGELEASNETEARVKLRAQKLVPLHVVTKGNFKKQSIALKGSRLRVNPKELQIFTRQFAVLVGSGVPIMQSLEAMATGGRGQKMIQALRGVLDSVGRGRPLAEAMGEYPLTFDRLYINLVKAGEEGGVLEVVLNRLAEYIEKSVKMKGKIMGALWYPAAIIIVAILVISGIMVFVIPNFVKMFSQSGQQIPALTQLVINASHFTKQYWWAMLGGVIGSFFLLRTYYETSDGRKVLDRIFIEVPVFGTLIQKGSIARVSRTLATLLGAGVRIMDALEIAGATAGNYVIEKALLEARGVVAKGKTLAEPLQKVKYFPSMVTQMISIGEQTGNIDTMLSKVADFYEDEVEAAAEAMTSLIEPLLMVFLGGIIAVIVIAMYLPIFNLAGAVGG
ncbi:MAG: type II secretion system F family protein [Bdellovibrionales bacterium]|nr:type II secretion system F family protein [Bdellovibrionales bacterium]